MLIEPNPRFDALDCKEKHLFGKYIITYVTIIKYYLKYK